MTRSKVKLELVANESARKVSFRKRKKGLLKKLEELTTLCGVEACAIIYSPYDTEPTVWPNTAGVHKVLARFMDLPEDVQSRQMLNQEGFLRLRVKKAIQQLNKLRKDNREKEVERFMCDCMNGERSPDELDIDEAQELCDVLDAKLMAISKRLEKIYD